jgi:hypothetical protein
MANLEPDISMGKWTWRISQNAVKAREAFIVLALLLVNDTEPE